MLFHVYASDIVQFNNNNKTQLCMKKKQTQNKK